MASLAIPASELAQAEGALDAAALESVKEEQRLAALAAAEQRRKGAAAARAKAEADAAAKAEADKKKAEADKKKAGAGRNRRQCQRARRRFCPAGAQISRRVQGAEGRNRRMGPHAPLAGRAVCERKSRERLGCRV
jgi:hypothetical protein